MKEKWNEKFDLIVCYNFSGVTFLKHQSLSYLHS